MGVRARVDEAVRERGGIGPSHDLDRLGVDGRPGDRHGRGACSTPRCRAAGSPPRLAGGVEERQQRVMPEPALERRRRALLLRVRRDEGGVEVDHVEPRSAPAAHTWPRASALAAAIRSNTLSSTASRVRHAVEFEAPARTGRAGRATPPDQRWRHRHRRSSPPHRPAPGAGHGHGGVAWSLPSPLKGHRSARPHQPDPTTGAHRHDPQRPGRQCPPGRTTTAPPVGGLPPTGRQIKATAAVVCRGAESGSSSSGTSRPARCHPEARTGPGSNCGARYSLQPCHSRRMWSHARPNQRLNQPWWYWVMCPPQPARGHVHAHGLRAAVRPP
jgi:hypothetical protein